MGFYCVVCGRYVAEEWSPHKAEICPECRREYELAVARRRASMALEALGALAAGCLSLAESEFTSWAVQVECGASRAV